jgi:hypothetical protein
LSRAGLYHREVYAAIVVLRCGQTEKGNVGVESGPVVGCRVEPPGTVWPGVGGDEIREARLVDRGVTGGDRLDDRLVDVDVDHFMTEVGEAGGDRGSDVAATDDREIHAYGLFISDKKGLIAI